MVVNNNTAAADKVAMKAFSEFLLHQHSISEDPTSMEQAKLKPLIAEFITRVSRQWRKTSCSPLAAAFALHGWMCPVLAASCSPLAAACALHGWMCPVLAASCSPLAAGYASGCRICGVC